MDKRYKSHKVDLTDIDLVSFSHTLHRGDMDELKKISQDKKISVSSLLREIIKDYVNNYIGEKNVIV